MFAGFVRNDVPVEVDVEVSPVPVVPLATIGPLVSPVSVPTLLTFGCAAVERVPVSVVPLIAPAVRELEPREREDAVKVNTCDPFL